MTILLDVEFRELDTDAIQSIPQNIALLSDKEWYVRKSGADALLELSKRGNISSFLT